MPNFPTGGFPPAFLADLRLALSEDQEDVLEEGLKHVEELLKTPTDAEFTRLASQIGRTTGCSTRTAMAVLRAVGSLSMWTVPDEDETLTVEKIETALREGLKKSDEEWTSEADARLSALAAKLAGARQNSERAFQVGTATRGVLPMFDSLLATLELRSTQLPSELSEKGGTERLELVPIASIRLDLDSGEPDFLCFQATEEQLASLREAVEELQKGMQSLKERVQVIS